MSFIKSYGLVNDSEANRKFTSHGIRNWHEVKIVVYLIGITFLEAGYDRVVAALRDQNFSTVTLDQGKLAVSRLELSDHSMPLKISY